MPDNTDIFETLIHVLEEGAVPYCILSGYDGYPNEIGSDVDFMILPEWLDRLPALMSSVARRSGGHLVQCLTHETTASFFVIARQNGPHVTFLHPDASTDYRRNGRLWLRAADILPHRRRHPCGFWVPAAEDAFTYYLIKKIDKGHLDEDQAKQLSRRFCEAPDAAAEALRKLLPPIGAQIVEQAARSGDWSQVRRSLPLLRKSLRQKPEAETLPERFRQAAHEARRTVDRIVLPSGLTICVLGPDGSGKSSVAAQVLAELAQAFRRARYQHLRPRLWANKSSSPAVTNPHANPLRGRWLSTAKLLHFWAGFLLGGLLQVLPARIRSTLLLFDRYYHDILADPCRYRYGGSLSLARKLGRFVPHPDLVFILDAPAELLQRRKKEVPFAESKRQRMAYLGLAREFANVHVIDASQPMEKVVAVVLKHAIAHLEARTQERLGQPGEAIA
jgi:thymidylate kinase